MQYRYRWLTPMTLLAGLIVLAAGLADGMASGAGSTAAPPPSGGGAAYSDVWGPPLGEPVPLLQALDQEGRLRSLGDLAGDRGLLLFLVRSADW